MGVSLTLPPSMEKAFSCKGLGSVSVVGLRERQNTIGWDGYIHLHLDDFLWGMWVHIPYMDPMGMGLLFLFFDENGLVVFAREKTLKSTYKNGRCGN